LRTSLGVLVGSWRVEASTPAAARLLYVHSRTFTACVRGLRCVPLFAQIEIAVEALCIGFFLVAGSACFKACQNMGIAAAQASL
jgi:hypothetical protein